MTTIAEFSDHRVQSTEFFLDYLKDYINTRRNIAGLSNNNIHGITFAKEHPIVTLYASQIANRSGDITRNSLIPTVGVTPGDMSEAAATIGESHQSEIVDDAFIADMRDYLNQTDIERFKNVLITTKQIEDVLSAYRRVGAKGVMRCESNMWGWEESMNVSCWSETIDQSMLMTALVDSALAKMKVGVMGDQSPMRNLKYRVARGLTNFNFGRVLYGSEFTLTFLNTYKNYTIYQEPIIGADSVDLIGTFNDAGEILK